MADDVAAFLPLAPAMLHILATLVAEDRHGYAIMQEVERQSLGHYKLGPGTLYDNLQKLLDAGLVKERTGPDGSSPRRRYYGLTALGQRVLAADLERLRAVVREAGSGLRALKPRRT
jgi:DNA-binding PadR family transcriptional regulator